ncbi:hypothetical protein JN531_016990 (plasmid) [Flagellatimonas centrodinii]|uniref:hypothetical protein n=1 Tax=Flagellatimonas centrodinii TaxID=2806210 RepID=UPI001FEDF531|nr:hypothetical protein [Flagellatimonas centrodinii]ULQ48329.1 hypothetical protein JN531_016990 [Flagellatimonas centrodinii]
MMRFAKPRLQLTKDASDFLTFLTLSLLPVLCALMPEIAFAQDAFEGGGFMGDTARFIEDIGGMWTVFSYVCIFVALVLLALGMFMPMASFLKWGALGALVVAAFGESFVTWAFDVGGNNNELLIERRQG